jgi:hypothetical protein
MVVVGEGLKPILWEEGIGTTVIEKYGCGGMMRLLIPLRGWCFPR